MNESFATLLVQPYETLLALLRQDLAPELRARLEAELKSRDRALHNQYVQINGGEFQ